MAVSREQLHAEVWAEPVAEVAKRYGVSGSFLARVCERLNVPRPPRGYWAAVKEGRTLPVPALPPTHPGDEKEWTPGGVTGRVTRVPTSPSVSTELVSRVTAKRHPLLIGAEQELESGRPMKEGYLRPRRQLFPDIFVSRDEMKRALSLASRLYNEIQARGHEVRIAAKDSGLMTASLDHRIDLRPRTEEHFGPRYPAVQFWRPPRPTVVFVGDVAIGLSVYEVSEYVRVHDDWLGSRVFIRKPDGNEKRDMPMGLLAIQVDAPYRWTGWSKTWRETKRGDLVTQLPAIVEDIIRAAPEVAKKAAAAERQYVEWKDRQAEEERVRARERAAAAAKAELDASRRRLAELIALWRRGRDLAAFLDAAAIEVAALDPAAREVAELQLARARDTLAPIPAVEVLRSWSEPMPAGFDIPFPSVR